jgi:hypothetical protein
MSIAETRHRTDVYALQMADGTRIGSYDTSALAVEAARRVELIQAYQRDWWRPGDRPPAQPVVRGGPAAAGLGITETLRLLSIVDALYQHGQIVGIAHTSVSMVIRKEVTPW